ncbi:MAG: hypothetical protein KatS3mg104_2177 [Phycisphaerae bacterium]|nr:MAG: hypothetical protein KatS3mg104_2177 [Phycisphaerae bacterium]
MGLESGTMVGLHRKWVGFGLLLGITGCQVFGPKKAEQPPLKAPELVIASRVYAGSVLSGPTPNELTEESFKSPWAISVRIWAIESLPTEGFERLARQARLVFTTRGGMPVVPSARSSSELLIRGISPDTDPEFLLGKPTDRQMMSELTTGLVSGMTLEVDLQTPTRLHPPQQPVRSGIEVRIARADESGQYSLGVVSQNLVPFFLSAPQTSTDQDWVSAPPLPVPQRVDTERETLLTDRTVQNESDRWLLVVPMRFEDSPSDGVIVDLTIQTQPLASDREKIVELLRNALGETASLDDDRPLSLLSEDELRMRSALEGLAKVTDTPRGAIVYLAGLCGAELTQSVGIIADPPLLESICRSILEQADRLSKTDRPSVAWLLERTTVEALSVAENNGTVSPSVRGVLAEYAGEVGRQIDALRSLVSQSHSSEDLKNRLMAENMIFLEDSSPSARVRAYDWLDRLGRAPDGYDPLASLRERRRALEGAAESRQTLQTEKQP